MKISFIGSGNVATQLALALNKISGVKIQQIVSRDKNHAKHLANQVKAEYTNDLAWLKTNFDLLIFSVSDNALNQLLAEIDLPDNKIICHTAGSVSSEIFAEKSRKYGVIYPLQTLSKGKDVDWSSVPILLTASDEATEKRLVHLAKQISKDIHVISDAQRFALHISAVFACNFANAMMMVSQELCQEQNLDFNLLQPLIRETYDKVWKMGPKNAQTGPAKRGDTLVMEKHLQFLESHPERKQLYAQVSEYIRKSS